MAAITTLVFVPNASAAPAGALTRLTTDTIPGLAALAPTGSTPAGQRIEVDVDLTDPSSAAETALYQAMYTKGSPDYHHFLTPAEYAARFSVPASEEAAAQSFATRDGMSVQSVTTTRNLIALTGTVGQAEKTFGVTIDNYIWHGLGFYANTAAPTVSVGSDIFGVQGLNSAQRAFTTNHAPPATAKHGTAPAQDTCDPSNSVCVGITTPNDLRSVYDAPSDNQGQGQSVAVFGEGAYSGPITDLRAFEKLYNLPQVPVNVVLTESQKPSDYSDTSGDGEWDLDMQSSTGIAPQVQSLDLYFSTAFYDADLLNMFSHWADDPNGPLQANASFGECEYDPVAAQLPSGDQFAAGQAFTVESEQILQQANMEGRTLFASAGDTGSSCPIVPVDVNGLANEAYPDVNYPCASPHAVCVGGTVLYTQGGDSEAAPDPTTHATRVLEYSWTFTGGGTSFQFPEPAYQTGQTAVVGQCLYDDTGAPTVPPVACRGVPDVAAQSGDVLTNGYSIYSGGSLSESGGTSLSSPLNVGMWALDQAAAPAGGNGFADPTFYANPSDFFDIGGGATSPPTSNGYFTSTPGWDYLSGLGVQDVKQLMTAVDKGTTPTDDVPAPNTGAVNVVVGSVDGTPAVTTTSGGSGTGTPTDPACVALFTGTPNSATYPEEGGVGSSEPQLDIVQGDMHLVTLNGAPALQTVLTIQNMEDGATAVAQPGGANEYYMTWTYKGTTYFTNTEVALTGDSFNYGSVSKVGTTSQYNNSGTAPYGKITTGPNGTIVEDVPLTDIGSPAVGDTLTVPAGAVYVLVGAAQVGGSLQPADSAGPGNDYTIGEVCAATGLPGSDGGAGPSGGTVPEAPLAIGIPVLGLGIAGGLILRRRRRAAAAQTIPVTTRTTPEASDQ